MDQSTPYIVIENALDEELYNRLSLEYPSLRDIKDSNIVNKQYENRQNHRFNMSVYDSIFSIWIAVCVIMAG